MICPHCNTPNVDSAKFCNECGRLLAGGADVTGVLSPDSHQTADLSGLDKIIDSSYVPDMPSRTGSTMHLPRIEIDDEPVVETERDSEALDKRNRLRVGLIVMAAFVALAVAAGVATYAMELWGGKVVPDVIGQSEANASYVLEQRGFTTETMLVKSDEVQGIVLLTDPAAGKRAPEGCKVVLHVSVGRSVPDVVGKTEDEAKALLGKEGFVDVTYVRVKSNDAEGVVLSVSPEPGTEGKATLPITVEVSEPYRVPETAGMTREQAVAALEAEGYSVNFQWHYAEELEEGLAYSTDPVAGTKLSSGSSVTLAVTIKRSTALVNETYAYLESSSQFSIGGINYEVSSVDSVEYVGEDKVKYSITARPFETYYWFGSIPDTRYGDSTTISGEIQWNSSNGIASANPSLKKL